MYPLPESETHHAFLFRGCQRFAIARTVGPSERLNGLPEDSGYQPLQGHLCDNFCISDKGAESQPSRYQTHGATRLGERCAQSHADINQLFSMDKAVAEFGCQVHGFTNDSWLELNQDRGGVGMTMPGVNVLICTTMGLVAMNPCSANSVIQPHAQNSFAIGLAVFRK